MRSDDYRLLDILEAIAKIERYTERGRGEFDRNELVQTWCLHHLLIIGEAVRSLSRELRLQHTEVPWVEIIAMRNILVHEYFGIDTDEVWRAVQRDLPTLKRQIQAIVKQSEAED